MFDGRVLTRHWTETARGAWEACGTPKRSRKVDLRVPFVVEVPALVGGLLRVYSRWVVASRVEVDDYLMMAVVVGCPVAVLVVSSLTGCTGVLRLSPGVWVDRCGCRPPTARGRGADMCVAAEKGMGVDIWTVDASDMTITLMVQAILRRDATVADRGSSSTSPSPSTWLS